MTTVFDSALWQAHAGELWQRTGEHLLLTGVSLGAAAALGVPLGLLAAGRARVRPLILGAAGIVQTVPSLALLALLLAALGRTGVVPALIALTLYALLPVLRATLTGVQQVPAQVREAADAMGLSARQRRWWVELPLALPVLVAGLRTAAVAGVGIATLSAFIGAGGLGVFINRGLALTRDDLVLLGAIPAALLALIVDGAIGAAQWALRPAARPSEPARRRRGAALRALALAAPAALVAVGLAAQLPARTAPPDGAAPRAVLRLGTKDFTEQLILGELLAQLVEARTTLAVERQFALGGTMICHQALAAGALDCYPEYTGTALTAVLGAAAISDRERTWAHVDAAYQARFGARWLRPFGFNNTYALTVRTEAATADLRGVSDLVARAGTLRAGFTAEFSARPDGYPGLSARYGLRFGEVIDLSPALIYEALARGEVDVIAAFATDGRIAAYELQVLDDDRRFFPPYDAAPVVRSAVLAAHPELAEVLGLLAGRIDDAGMQRLNRAVDLDRREPRAVAREFLVTQGLIAAD